MSVAVPEGSAGSQRTLEPWSLPWPPLHCCNLIFYDPKCCPIHHCITHRANNPPWPSTLLPISYCQSGHVLLLNQPCLDTCEAREKTERDGGCSDFSNAWFWFDSISLMFSSKLYKKHLIPISLSPMCLLALPLIFPEIRAFHFFLEVDVLYIVL